MNDLELAASVTERIARKVRDTDTLGEAVVALLDEVGFESLAAWSDVLNAAEIPFFHGEVPQDLANTATAFAFVKGLMMGRER